LWAFAVSCKALDDYLVRLAEQIWSNLFVMLWRKLWRKKKTQIPNITSNSSFVEIIFVAGHKSNIATRDSEIMQSGKALGSCKMPVPD
jgi:hypothetical protein